MAASVQTGRNREHVLSACPPRAARNNNTGTGLKDVWRIPSWPTVIPVPFPTVWSLVIHKGAVKLDRVCFS